MKIVILILIIQVFTGLLILELLPAYISRLDFKRTTLDQMKTVEAFRMIRNVPVISQAVLILLLIVIALKK